MADKDYIDINTRGTKNKDVLKAELIKVQQEYTGKHEPFDFRNALKAIEDYSEQWTKEVTRALSDRANPPGFKNNWDWNEYGKNDRFEKISTTPVRDTNPKLGQVTPTLIGYNVDYVVKGKGNGVSVFVPIEEWEKRNKK